MGEYKINYIEQPLEEITNSSSPMVEGMSIKEAFWDHNMSIYSCISMILGEDIKKIRQKAPHRLLYDKYIGGFVFEEYKLLPPLCILNVIFENMPHNAVYYNHIIYDPKFGIFTIDKYKNKNIQVLSYIQIFIEEAYAIVAWKPPIPQEIQSEFDKDKELNNYFSSLSAVEQSKILNYCYPYSKPSSLLEKRTISQKLNSKQVESIIKYIKGMYPSVSDKHKNVWDELNDFETIEAVETLKKCGLAIGNVVIDMGCGHGHYTIPASLVVSENGRIIAVDRDKKVLKQVEKRISQLNMNNVFCLNSDEKGLAQYYENVDFIILYDVLHGIYNRDNWSDKRSEFVSILNSLLKSGGILSLALFSEIERKADSSKKIPSIQHEEAIKPYIELLESYGFALKNVVQNGGVHFDDFHSPYHWKKYGEVRVSTLERRNIYNFVKRLEL